MRKSRVLLAGVAVAAAAAATSAFTASNDIDPSVAGYGQAEVTGATVTNVHYVVNAADGTVLDAVEFTTTTDVTDALSTMTLKSGAVAGVGGTVEGTPYSCSVKTGDEWDNTSMVLLCTTADHPNFEDFNAVGLTVGLPSPWPVEAGRPDGCPAFSGSGCHRHECCPESRPHQRPCRADAGGCLALVAGQPRRLERRTWPPTASACNPVSTPGTWPCCGPPARTPCGDVVAYRRARWTRS